MKFKYRKDSLKDELGPWCLRSASVSSSKKHGIITPYGYVSEIDKFTCSTIQFKYEILFCFEI